jgi:hypothetical protein
MVAAAPGIRSVRELRVSAAVDWGSLKSLRDARALGVNERLIDGENPAALTPARLARGDFDVMPIHCADGGTPASLTSARSPARSPYSIWAIS